jgi:hypothetical protein
MWQQQKTKQNVSVLFLFIIMIYVLQCRFIKPGQTEIY